MNRNPYAPPVAAVEDTGESCSLPPATILSRLERQDFGGFWLRLLALFIDGVVMFPFDLLIAYTLSGVAPSTPFSQTQMGLLDVAMNQIVWAIYTIGFWASPWQATIGKHLCGLVVVSNRLGRLSLAHAAARYLATGLYAFLIVGALTVPVSARRRALHDMLARTLVAKRRSLTRAMCEKQTEVAGGHVVPAA